jgi:HD-GYP domain-containing protein (c-di-GMP phosphodiesterase class II)
MATPAGAAAWSPEYLFALADRADIHAGTAGHGSRVALYTAALLKALRVPVAEAATIVAAARLHDIGKLAVAADTLTMRAPLTTWQRRDVRDHVRHGANLLLRGFAFAGASTLVLYHHEHIDGSGYPDGLPGESIPLGSRVIAVADAFDAMSSNRPYRAALQRAQACGLLLQGAGSQWDSELVTAFLDRVVPLLERFPCQGRTALAQVLVPEHGPPGFRHAVPSAPTPSPRLASAQA